MYDTLSTEFDTWPNGVQKTLQYIGTVGFVAVILGIILFVLGADMCLWKLLPLLICCPVPASFHTSRRKRPTPCASALSSCSVIVTWCVRVNLSVCLSF